MVPCRKDVFLLIATWHVHRIGAPRHAAIKEPAMIPFVTLTDTRGQKVSVNPEIVQFVRTADNKHDECLIVFGKDQLLRVRGTLEEVTGVLREG
jgi:hypothetical protein